MAISGLTKVYVNVDKGRCGDKAVGFDYGVLGGGCYALAKLGNTAVADGYIAYACVCLAFDVGSAKDCSFVAHSYASWLY